jgi:hypothetical protein
MSDLIDTPTAHVLNRYSMELNFRLYYNGGVVSRISFGVFDRMNIGCSLDIDSLIGITTPEIRQPSLNLKFRLFDGTKNLPAFAVGYDGQGYRYDTSTSKYLHKEKGVYLAGSIEALTKNLEFNFGSNVNSIRSDNGNNTELHWFIGTTYTLQKNEQRLLCFMAECDNIFRGNRLNSGVRFFTGLNLNIDLSIIDIVSSENTESAERLVKINYQGQF